MEAFRRDGLSISQLRQCWGYETWWLYSGLIVAKYSGSIVANKRDWWLKNHVEYSKTHVYNVNPGLITPGSQFRRKPRLLGDTPC